MVGRCCSPLTAEKVSKGKFDIFDIIEDYLLKKTNVGPAKNIASDDDLKKVYRVAHNFYVLLERKIISIIFSRTIRIFSSFGNVISIAVFVGKGSLWVFLNFFVCLES